MPRSSAITLAPISHVPIRSYAEERLADGWTWAHIPDEFKDYQYDALMLLTSKIRIGFGMRAFRDAGMKHFVLDFHRHGLDPVDIIHEQMER